MNHDEWRIEIARLMSLDSSLRSVRDQWEELIARIEATMQSSVREWHIQQTLSLYSNDMRECADLEAAAVLDERIGDDAEAQIKYWHTAAGTALAQAALDRFKLGNDDDRALELARRAIRHRDHTQDSSQVFDDLFAELRSRGES